MGEVRLTEMEALGVTNNAPWTRPKIVYLPSPWAVCV
jgi:hypothetical protein